MSSRATRAIPFKTWMPAFAGMTAYMEGIRQKSIRRVARLRD
jgi:hypothetical protein